MAEFPQRRDEPKRGDQRSRETEPTPMQYACDALSREEVRLAIQRAKGGEEDDATISEYDPEATIPPADFGDGGDQFVFGDRLVAEADAETNKAGGGDRAHVFPDLQAAFVVDGVSSAGTMELDTAKVIPMLRLVVERIQQDETIKDPIMIVASLRGWLMDINSRLYTATTTDGSISPRARTMTLLLSFVHNGRLYSASIGDSYTQYYNVEKETVELLHPRHTVLYTLYADEPVYAASLEDRFKGKISEQYRDVFVDIIRDKRPSDVLLVKAGFELSVTDEEIATYLLKYAFAIKTFGRNPESFNRDANECISIVHREWKTGDRLVMHSDGIRPKTMENALRENEHPVDVIDRAIHETVREFVEGERQRVDDIGVVCLQKDAA